MCLLSIDFLRSLILQLPRLTTFLFLTGFAVHSSALTIGRPQGAVWIGKPLDLVVPLSLTASELGESLCLGAEVTQGDAIIADRNINVSFEPGSGQGGSRMRIRSSVAIDEPVVSVNVRAGCEARSIRNYTLLADVPSDIAAPVIAQSPARARSIESASQDSSSGGRSGGAGGSGGSGFGGAAGGSDGAGSSTPAQRSAPVRRRPVAPVPSSETEAVAPAPRRPAPPPAQPRQPVASQPVTPRVVPRAAPARPVTEAAPAAAPSAPAASGPRLQVDALDPTPTARGGLRTSSQLAMPPSEDPARRAEAAAQWRAISGEPAAPSAADAQRAQVVQAMEATLAQLREQTAQNQRSLVELRSELAQARESRYRNPLVYALVVLLLLALIGLAMLWRMTRRSATPAWWGDASGPGGRGGPQSRMPPREDDDAAFSATAAAAGGAAFGAAALADDDSRRREDDHPQAAHPVPPIDLGPTRSVNTEELFDVQQQSDFFLSLGQHEQAIAVLQEHIAENPGTSALAYLDLLRIFHSLDRREDYADVAAEFERAFNADVPPFERFNESTGKGLEHYGAAMARIQAKWPEPGTLALIEELVFRKPGGHGDDAFDLAAYQELLLLYSVAKEVIDPHSPTVAAPIASPIASPVAEPFADTFVQTELKTRPADLKPELQWEAPDLPHLGGEQPDTAVAPLDVVPPSSSPVPLSASRPNDDSDNRLPSIFGALDDRLKHDTELTPLPESPPGPEQPASAAFDPPLQPQVQPRPQSQSSFTEPPLPADLADFDRTSYETVPSPLEAQKSAPAPIDPHTIDFELFDPATEAEIAPKPPKPKA
ncbi:conserved hypothetical protein [Burkholderiales bacterium 8X]|nr:conserved hypothetical protein [Burkholderiales bacterium 8X]